MSYIVGVDIGGTFTDASAVRLDDGRVFSAKATSTPDDLTEGLMEALRFLASEIGETLEKLLADTVKFALGTTQTSNIVFTWIGAQTGLITTQGFADEILIMRARGRVAGVGLAQRRHLRATDKPPSIVPRELIFEVPERVDHKGHVVVPLRDEDAVAAVDSLLAAGVESIAVSLLWSPQNPVHELRIGEIIANRAPELHVSLSHQLAPVVGEYERTSTTVVNAFVGPTVERYLERLDETLRSSGLTTPLLVLQANGGVTESSQTVPVNTIESGPAAGMVAVKALANAAGYERVIATDVGGTTFKVGLLVDGEWSVARETIINQYALLIPMINLVSIGAGGGSIAWVDDSRLRIGPLSAGADPGPACYGWGGTRPTVTDADLVLGFLNPDRFLGGRLRLNEDLAEAAIKEYVAEPLFGGDVVKAAAAIRKIVDAQMADLLHKQTIELGHDPRSFVLMAYGGAGPLHAAGYAKGLGVASIVIPRAATAYSAYGAAASDLRTSVQRSVPAEVLSDSVGLGEFFGELEASAMEVVRRQSVEPTAISKSRWVDMRYARQLHDIRVPVPDQDGDSLIQAVSATFEALYGRVYGEAALMPSADVQLLRAGVDVVGQIAKPSLPAIELGTSDPRAAAAASRSVYWPEAEDWLETQIFDGDALRPGHLVVGPSVIEEAGTTIVVPPEAQALVDTRQNTIITLGVLQ